jgi:hypothetical protein
MVSGPTCRSAGLLAGRAHLSRTSRTLVGGVPWVPMSHGPRVSTANGGVEYFPISTYVLTTESCVVAGHSFF